MIALYANLGYNREVKRMRNQKINLLPEIQNRSSVLLYEEDREIEPEKLAAVMEAARLAPSARNLQPWRYIVVQEKTQRDRMVKAMNPVNFWASSAPCLITQISHPPLGYTGEGKCYYLYDCGLSVMSLVIEAQHQELKCRQIAAFEENKIRGILAIPADWQVIVVVAIGYQGDLEREKPHLLKRWGIVAYSRVESRLLNSRTRKTMEEIVSYGKFNNQDTRNNNQTNSKSQ